ATNPAVSLPDAGLVRAAIDACPFVVLSDCYRDTDTAAFADVLLPATGWGEKDGTVTNSDRVISRQRALRPAHAEARADWAQMAAVGRALGHDDAFAWPNAAAVFREHAALSGFENDGARLFDIAALADLSDADYADLAPTRWPLTRDGDGASDSDGRLFADRRFPTPNGRARLSPLRQTAPAHATDDRYPLILNTGRYRDQWHTMTRTALAPQLNRHRAEPLIEIHPDDAAARGLKDDGFADIATAWGAGRFKVRITPDQTRGQVFAPMHWSGANSSGGGVGPLVNPAVDALSGQPESKHTPCQLAAWSPERRGYALTRRPMTPATGYWVRWGAPGDVQVYELAGDSAAFDDLAAQLDAADAEHIDYADAAAGARREAWIVDGRLAAALYRSAGRTPNARDRLIALFAQDALSVEDRIELIAGRAAKPGTAPGPIVCACAGVGANMIAAAIDSGAATSVDCLGRQRNAGVTCGACRPELQTRLDAARRDLAA
ncbi:MAG: molybdopterin dinucleotide binding domain-containing protein, partial [Pseudomonadota bacterium]